MVASAADPLLELKHSGRLTVIIHTLSGGLVESFTLNFTDTMLFDYVGEACARIFTNITIRLTIRTRPGDWNVLKFSPEKEILEVQQTGGEDLVIEEDDPERLSNLLGIQSE